jgi:hypothetical protein
MGEFLGVFVAGFNPARQHRDVWATLSLFIGDSIEQPEICLFWACKWPNQVRGDMREGGSLALVAGLLLFMNGVQGAGNGRALSEQIRLLCQNVGTGFRGH